MGLHVLIVSLFAALRCVLFAAKMVFHTEENQASDFSLGKKSKMTVLKNVSLGRAKSNDCLHSTTPVDVIG